MNELIGALERELATVRNLLVSAELPQLSRASLLLQNLAGRLPELLRGLDRATLAGSACRLRRLQTSMKHMDVLCGIALDDVSRMLQSAGLSGAGYAGGGGLVPCSNSVSVSFHA